LELNFIMRGNSGEQDLPRRVRLTEKVAELRTESTSFPL
jgi:hypothetical protein